MSFPGHRRVGHPDGSTADAWVPFTCGHCGVHVHGAVVGSYATTTFLACTSCGKGSVKNGTLISPAALPGTAVEGLPPDIRDAYEETRRALAAGAPTAAELICRKILMHVAVDKGAKEGEQFVAYIAFLETAGYITPPMKKWVDLIRTIGNAATRKLEPPDMKRAESALVFTAQLLRVVYEMEHLASKHT